MLNLFISKNWKILLSTFIAGSLILSSSFANAKDVEIENGGTSQKENVSAKTSADDWKNDAGDIIVKGAGSETETGSVVGKKVNINSGTFTGVFGGMTSIGNASKNTVNFRDGNVTGGIVGGFTFYDGENLTAGDVFNNTVNFLGGSANWVSGGEVGYIGSISDYLNLSGGNVYGNKVNISGGEITGGVVGGSALTGSAYDNKIEISGGKISGEVIAGEVVNPTSNSSVTGNVIEIYGSPDLSKATLIGGYFGDGYSASGNLLKINTAGISIGNIESSSFEKIHFDLPVSVTADSDVLYMNRSSDLELNKIDIALKGNSPLQTNDTFNLVVDGLAVSSDLVSSADAAGSVVTVNAAKGALLTGTVDLLSTGSGVTATVGEFEPKNSAYEEVAKTSEGEFAKVIIPELDPFTQSMTDFLLDEDENDDSSTEAEFGNVDIAAVSGYSIFLNSGGGKIKTKTGGGTYIKTSRGSYDLGFARTFEGLKAGRLYIAPVFERAQGHYNAVLPKNSFGEWMRGNGSTKYTAGGFIARVLTQNGFYYEGSIRGGRMENSFASSDFIINDVKTRVTYDMKAPVWTGHLRLGKAQKLSPKTLLDTYLMYSYTHQNGMNTRMSEGTHVEFDSVSGHSARIGYRMTTRSSKISKVYAGMAYQYDKNSDSSVTAFNQEKSTEGAKGSSGMIELGWQIKPNKENPWIVDINATGWMGRMSGFNVTAKIQKSF